MDDLTVATPAVVLESDHLQNLAEARLAGRGLLSGRSTAYATVEAWHDLTHSGTFRFCAEQPCHALNYRGWAR